MAEEKIAVFEWKIENFSCWCEAVHGKCIQSPEIFGYCSPFVKVDLYPRGFSGQDDQMKVSFCDVKSNLIGDLALVCSDGSSICSQQLEITQKGERVPGPSLDLKFEQVVDQLRKADQKDEIILRFCIQSASEKEQRMCTTIGVWKVSYKIDPKLVESFQSNQSEEIAYFRYSSKIISGICLEIARQDERVKLMMNRYSEGKAILVESSMSVLSSDNVLVRMEVVKHVFLKEEKWVFSESLTEKELEGKGITILWGLKVVNGEIVERYNHGIDDKKVSIVPNNCCTCVCQKKSPNSLVPSKQPEDSSTELKKDLMCLYQDQKFSDFRLRCGNVTFPGHKNILSARSPVLDRLLSSDMQEAASGEVVIEDLDPSTLGLFLTFLYTGTVDEDLQSDSALKLYYAADKYQVPSLKRECGDFLCSNVSVSNVCDILSLAEKLGDAAMTSAAHDFVLKNFDRVLGSEEWRSFSNRESLLAVETLTHLARMKVAGLSVPQT